MAHEIPTIPIELLPQLTEIQTAEEDWTGKTSQSERRKLQNRLNQRARSEFPRLDYPCASHMRAPFISFD